MTDETPENTEKEVEEKEPISESVSAISESKEVTDDTEDPEDGYIIMPISTHSKVKEVYKKFVELQSDDEKLAKYRDDAGDEALGTVVGLAAAMGLHNDRNVYVAPANKEDAVWENVYKYADKTITSRELKSSTLSGDLKGGAASSAMYSRLNMAGTFQVALWHSGFHVTMRAPTDSEIVSMQTMLAANEISLGRLTNRFIYSNYDVVFMKIVTDFCLKLVIDSSVEYKNKESLLKMIKVQDRYLLAHGAASLMYSKGYRYARFCSNSAVLTNGVPTCTAQQEGVIVPKYLMRADVSQLTVEQKKHMLKRTPGSMTRDEVIEYQSTLGATAEERYDIENEDGDVVFSISVAAPNIEKAIEGGQEWVDRCVDSAAELFTTNTSLEEKNEKVTMQARAAEISMYSSFVTKISFSETAYITKRADIQNNLNIAANDSVVSGNIIKAILKYINTHVIAMAMVEEYVCPSCKKAQEDANMKKTFGRFLPVNVYTLFFDLGATKTRQIINRDLSKTS